MKPRHAPLLFALLAGAGLRADVALAPLFTDHAVLQQGRPVPVWGRAEPGEKVSVAYRGRAASVVAGKSGHWAAYLDALEPSGDGADLVVAGRNTVTLHDVVVGEVWLCSGQSNMEFPLVDATGWVHGSPDRVQNAAEELAHADHPLIRQFKVERQVSASPRDDAHGAWVRCSPATAGDFTAVGYFFAREIHERLGVPVGIVNSTWGGTPIESWMPAEALASDPAFAGVARRWEQTLAGYPAKAAAYPALLDAWNKRDAAAQAAGDKARQAFLRATPKPPKPRGPGNSWTPSGLFNGMISPLQPYALRGVLWYQGESNAERAGEYHRLFDTMIRAWRIHFGQGDLPFYWVQLAAYQPPSDKGGVIFAELREAQAEALSLPATGMAVAIDVGDPNDIHPKNKQEVGRRLALIAKAKTYDIPGDYSGPVFRSAERSGPGMRVHFVYADGGLTAAGGPLRCFEVAGVDRKFHPAEASIEGQAVWVRSADVPDPVAVRYAWSDAPSPNLYSGDGLPAAPFRSDSW